MQKGDYLVTFASIIIDDILLWTGDITLGVLGGGGTHAIAGCGIWWDKIAIAFPVGEDFGLIKNDMLAANINIIGVKATKNKTLRHWQIFYHDGTRIEIPRDPRINKEYNFSESPDFSTIPALFSTAAGYHVQANNPLSMIENIRNVNKNAAIVYEPGLVDDIADCKQFFSKVLPMVDAFSPNLKEGETITGEKDPLKMIDILFQWGCKWAIIRMGEKGSLSGTKNGKFLEVPPAPANMVDPTGAGNSYMGGLLYGIAQEREVEECLAMAAVSASFAIEQYGIAKRNITERENRYRTVIKNIKSSKL